MNNLFLVRYPEAPIRVPMESGITIGRTSKNDIVLADPRVSRQHAVIRWERSLDGFVLVDLGTSNGTFVNNGKIPPNKPYRLIDFEKIRVASAVFTVRTVDDPLELYNEYKELRVMEDSMGTQIFSSADFLAGHEQPAIAGRLEHLCPIEIFQMLQAAGKTGTLVLNADSCEGTFAIQNGNIILADFKDVRNENAVYEAMKITSGTFIFTPQETFSQEPEITVCTEFLLMEGCRLLDESSTRKMPAV